MKIARFTRIVSCALLPAVFASPAWAAQDTHEPASAYPSRPIRLIVPATAGGAGDIFARTVGQGLSQKFGKQVVVDNRPGANGIVGCELVARSIPDGYTLLMGNSAFLVINPNLYRKLPYDAIADFEPVTQGTIYGYVLVVHPSIAASNVQELVALAKAKPGALTYGSMGLGAVNHLAGEMFKSMTGANITHIPYKGSAAALAEVLGGQASMMFDTLITSVPQLKAGKLRALGVTLAKRSPLLPEVATLNEQGLKGYEVNSWQSIIAPARTPRAIVDKLHTAIAQTLRQPEVIDRLVTQGGNEIVATPPGPFKAIIKNEMARYATVVKTVGLRLD